MTNGTISDSNTIRPSSRRKIALIASACGNDPVTEKDDCSSAGTTVLCFTDRDLNPLRQIEQVASSPRTDECGQLLVNSCTCLGQLPAQRRSVDSFRVLVVVLSSSSRRTMPEHQLWIRVFR